MSVNGESKKLSLFAEECICAKYFLLDGVGSTPRVPQRLSAEFRMSLRGAVKCLRCGALGFSVSDFDWVRLPAVDRTSQWGRTGVPRCLERRYGYHAVFDYDSQGDETPGWLAKLPRAVVNRTEEAASRDDIPARADLLPSGDVDTRSAGATDAGGEDPGTTPSKRVRVDAPPRTTPGSPDLVGPAPGSSASGRSDALRCPECWCTVTDPELSVHRASCSRLGLDMGGAAAMLALSDSGSEHQPGQRSPYSEREHSEPTALVPRSPEL